MKDGILVYPGGAFIIDVKGNGEIRSCAECVTGVELFRESAREVERAWGRRRVPEREAKRPIEAKRRRDCFKESFAIHIYRFLADNSGHFFHYEIANVSILYSGNFQSKFLPKIIPEENYFLVMKLSVDDV